MTEPDHPQPTRSEQIAAGLDAVRHRIARACSDAGRDPGEVTLIVVTKTYPVSDVVRLAALGVLDVGENREQEASATASAAAEAGLAPRWHFLGRLQSNKARSVAGFAHLVHSVDRPSLLAPLARGAAERGAPLGCLVQVSLDGDTHRGGTAPEDVPALAAAVAGTAGLHLAGVMAVAPLGADPDRAFARLAALHERLLRDHPDAVVRSAGMSGDLEAAVREGATHLRVGTAVLGSRASLR